MQDNDSPGDYEENELDDNGWDTDDYDSYSDDCDDGAEVRPCPECGADIYEETEQCPVCGTYVTFSTSIWSGRSPIWVLLGLAGIIAVVFVLLLQ